MFAGNGRFETQWNNLHRPNGMCMALGPNPLVYIGEGGPSGEINSDWPNIGFTSPHGIAVDRHGNIFVGELSGRSWGGLPRVRLRNACASCTSWERSPPDRCAAVVIRPAI